MDDARGSALARRQFVGARRGCCCSRCSPAAPTSPGGSAATRAETFADPVAQFKYGSTGGDRNFGLPYVMWEAMPHLFRRPACPRAAQDEGWAAFGFLYEDPADLPPELAPPPPGRHLAPQPHGHRPHLPELRRLPCRQRADRRRRRAADRRRHALEHRRSLGLPGLPRPRRRGRALHAPTGSWPRSTTSASSSTSSTAWR